MNTMAIRPNPEVRPPAASASASAPVRLALITPDGAGLRNFVEGSFLQTFPGETLVIHPFKQGLPAEVTGLFKERVEWQWMGPNEDQPYQITVRQTLSYAHVYWGNTTAMQYTRERKPSGSWKMKLAARAARVVGRAAGQSGAALLGLERYYFDLVGRQHASVERYREMFRRFRPDALLSTSQQSPVCLPAVMAARSLGIPTLCFVSSWDNLTSKGRIAAPYDRYLVWSEHMREEMRRFYAHIDAGRINVVGTPQFDFYGDPSIRMTREEFFKMVGADPARKLICYSGGDDGTSPEDHLHVRVLMEHVRAGRIRGNPQVLVRPSPVDPGERYASVRRDFPEMIYCQPKWLAPQKDMWSQYIPLPEDARFLANLVRHADLNLNVASTMALDFGLHDRPVISIGFDLASPPPLRVPMGDLFYTWDHYKPVVDLGASRLARSADEEAQFANEFLDNPALGREGRKKLADMQVGAPLGASAALICQVIDGVVSEDKKKKQQKAGAAAR